MKFMKLGNRPDTFYTEEATRTVLSDVAADLVIRVNNTTYLLHKFPLVPKCGLLQRLCSDMEDSNIITLDLHDIPGGEDSFELCAKFCYGITINLSAHNFVSAFCAAKFLQMTETVDKGNFVTKLELFFSSCILEGWKDTIVTLQTTGNLPEWSENIGIIRRSIDSIIEKIFTSPGKVRWSYTYTRPGFAQKHHKMVPKDWWTEDIADLDIDLFRYIITAVRSANVLPPQLIGEALHVYACRWLLAKTRSPECVASQTEESKERKRRVLETIVSMIPASKGSVSIEFLMRLLGLANSLGVSPVTKRELVRQTSLQLEDATVNDLVGQVFDIDLVEEMLEHFLVQWRRQPPGDDSQRSIKKVAKLIDSYLQVVARDSNLPSSKMVSLVEALPELARPNHDELYKAINIYLKEHPDLPKAEKKHLCGILDCQKLSPEICAHAMRNERLPLRTVVKLLFFEQERGARSTTHEIPPQWLQTLTPSEAGLSRLNLDVDKQSSKETNMKRGPTHSTTKREHREMTKSEGKLQTKTEEKVSSKKAVGETNADKGREVRDEGISRSKLDSGKLVQRRSK